jgi:hypothetical protein
MKTDAFGAKIDAFWAKKCAQKSVKEEFFLIIHCKTIN